jgi:hydroxyacylglutathione hydrolase
MFQRFSDEGLAQSSYLIACERTREAVVVDPRRDIDVFVDSARRHQLTIVYAVETHTHADFVSGARELAELGARVVAGPGADLQFSFHEASHRETLRIGDIVFELLHTPGHTPEHISVLVRENENPARVLTGDTLFVGAVGRPDLLGPEQARALAGELYDSLFGTLLTLGDDVEVHPGHGAGSLCGTGIGKDAHSTIGQERRFNPLLQEHSKESFVAAVLNDLPPTPPYFARMKRLNRSGPPLRGLADGVPPLASLTPRQARETLARGAVLFDLRSAEAFAAGHPSGALNVGFGSRVGYWAGWLVPEGSTLVLLAGDPHQAEEAGRQLLRIGFDDVRYLEGGYAAWKESGEPISTLQIISAQELHDRLVRRASQTLVDVRTPHEWRERHVDGAINIPVGELMERAHELKRGAVVATICESGYRSSLAASLLLRAGIEVVNVSEGTAAYLKLENV